MTRADHPGSPRVTVRRALTRNPLHVARSQGFPWVGAPTPLGVDPLPGPALEDRYDADWARHPVARWTRVAAQETVGRLVNTALCRPEVQMRDRLEGLEGPAVFAANHHSHLDTGLVVGALPRPWRHELAVAAAADHFFGSRGHAVLAAWAWGAVPMERRRTSRRSADRAAELLEHGWSLLIFPEGGRSPDGWGQEHKGGAAYLASRCGVPVVPVHLGGTDRVLPKGRRWPTPARVTVTFGEPLRAGPSSARRFAGELEAALAALADEVATDWYSARLRARAGSSPSLRGPEMDTWRRDWARDPVNGSDRRSWRDRARGNDPW